MTKAELLELIRNGENSFVEFKRDDVENFKLARELVAFGNMGGGRVLLGVDDDRTVVGVTRPDLEQWVMTTCRTKIRPELVPDYAVFPDVEPGKDVAVVTVERGLSVHHVWHDNHRTYLMRVGSQSREASFEELTRLSQQRGYCRIELRPVSGSSFADLDVRRLKDYFSRVRQQEAPENGDVDAWRQLLTNTEFLDDGGACTAAGLLLFGNNPYRFLPHDAIDAVAFPGTEKDYATLEHTQLKGPMVGLFYKTPDGVKLFEPGLVEQAAYFIRRNTGVTAHLEGAIRVERSDYPEEVVREAITNALVHRDYALTATDIELSIYADRLEIISPGSLPNGITPDRMRVGCRSSRNQLVRDVMRDYGYMEHLGMGVPRKLIKGMRQHNDTEPDLIEQDESFLVRLWKEKKA